MSGEDYDLENCIQTLKVLRERERKNQRPSGGAKKFAGYGQGQSHSR